MAQGNDVLVQRIFEYCGICGGKIGDVIVLINESDITQIMAEIFCEPKTSEEMYADYLREYLSDCPKCNARSLTHCDWLTYITDALRFVDLYH